MVTFILASKHYFLMYHWSDQICDLKIARLGDMKNNTYHVRESGLMFVNYMGGKCLLGKKSNLRIFV